MRHIPSVRLFHYQGMLAHLFQTDTVNGVITERIYPGVNFSISIEDFAYSSSCTWMQGEHTGNKRFSCIQVEWFLVGFSIGTGIAVLAPVEHVKASSTEHKSNWRNDETNL